MTIEGRHTTAKLSLSLCLVLIWNLGWPVPVHRNHRNRDKFKETDRIILKRIARYQNNQKVISTKVIMNNLRIIVRRISNKKKEKKLLYVQEVLIYLIYQITIKNGSRLLGHRVNVFYSLYRAGKVPLCEMISQNWLNKQVAVSFIKVQLFLLFLLSVCR